MVRIGESRRVEARGLGCVARGCESFSRSRFPNNEKSAPLTKVIVSRDTVYPRRSVLAAVCVETGRKKFRALARSSPPRAQTVSLDPSSHGLAARRHLSCVANGLLTVPRPYSRVECPQTFLGVPPARVPACSCDVVCPCPRVRVSACPRVRVSVPSPDRRRPASKWKGDAPSSREIFSPGDAQYPPP